MMKHLNVLLIKLISSILVFWIAFDLFFDATFSQILSFALLVTIVSYFIGDRILLPRLGNAQSVAIDFFLTYSIVWVFGSVLFESYLIVAWGSIISAALFAVSELIVHAYIARNVRLPVPERNTSFNQRLAYEFAEEQDPDPRKEK
ncbi:YndM family protein [Cytobacillus sp. FJAT-54145]|uniref:YndM family protein n=1 Tax=Cytobacillus spartinae TaxID=3299023 RepID=A0ABW6K8D8_9BACI